MTLRTSSFVLVVAVFVALVAAGAVLLALRLPTATSPPTAAYCGCPVGAPCAQEISLGLMASNGTFPTHPPNVANLTVGFVAPGVAADDLQLRPAYDGQMSGAPFVLTLETSNGSRLASFNSTGSNWTGQGGYGDFGGWVSGGGTVVVAGDVLAFDFSEVTYAVVGAITAECAGLVTVTAGSPAG